MSRKVIGIDPAPRKEATIYDGKGWSTVKAIELPEHVRERANSEGSLLICWDAPLTSGQLGRDGCYYERPIEKFFRKQRGYVVPKGISVRAYAGCPHWTVTRASLGLPRVGNYDKPVEDLPFALCVGGAPPTDSTHNHVVEVHPAGGNVALVPGETRFSV